MKFQVLHFRSTTVVLEGDYVPASIPEGSTEKKAVLAHVKGILSGMVTAGKCDAQTQFKVALLQPNGKDLLDSFTLKAGTKAQRKPPKAAPAAKVA